jgi:predicted transcriptional regulator
MGRQVVVDLPDEVYRRAERLAQLTKREVSDVLADTIALSLPPLAGTSAAEGSLAELSDGEVVELTELQLPSAQDKRLSKLLDKQQAKGLSEAERTELEALMRLYQEGLLRKAQALAEAVSRGLRVPLES